MSPVQARQGGADLAPASELGKESGLNWDQVVNGKLPAGAAVELLRVRQINTIQKKKTNQPRQFKISYFLNI